jgi:Protein of unknown function with HXXEE motif
MTVRKRALRQNSMSAPAPPTRPLTLVCTPPMRLLPGGSPTQRDVPRSSTHRTRGSASATNTVSSSLVRIETEACTRCNAVFIQCVHLAEEMWSGFYGAFPPVVGGSPWSARQFVIFNVIWLAVFLAAILGVLHHWRPAYVATLFLAIGGGIANGLGHIVLALQAHAYFPGLYTAPFALLVGITLLIRHRPGAKPVVAAI